MKIIFLDIDGVLNCEKTPNSRKFPYVVDKKLLLRVNGLVERTRAKVVLSSSWRCDPVGLLAAKHWGVPFIDEDDELDGLPLFQPSCKTGITPRIVKGVERYLNGQTDETMRANAIVRLGQNIHSLFKRSKS
jgi:hypothetical protein